MTQKVKAKRIPRRCSECGAFLGKGKRVTCGKPACQRKRRIKKCTEWNNSHPEKLAEIRERFYAKNK